MRRAALAFLALAAARPAAADPFDAQPPASSAPKVDLLLVVDTSAAAASLRASLPADVAPFLGELGLYASRGGQLALDLHVGVITADPADGGALRPTAADCAAAPGLPYVSYALADDGTTQTNYSGALADAITCLLPPAGATGADVAQPFATITTALGGGIAADAGFRRPDAKLAILVITVQDDCSPLGGAPPDRLQCAEEGWSCTPALDDQPGDRTCYAIGQPPGVASMLAPFDAITAGTPAGEVVFGVLGGDASPIVVTDGPALAPSCASATIAATPSLRLDLLAGAFGLTWTGSACAAGGFADFGYVISESVEPQVPPDDYDCDGGFYYGDDAGHFGDQASAGGCGCRGSRQSSGGLLLVAISMLGVARPGARRSSPSRRCRARRARAAG